MKIWNLSEIVRMLSGSGAPFLVANQARPPSSYLFARILPEVNSFSYEAKSGSMTVKSVMAGLSAMDSPYPEGAVLSAEAFSENTAKIANQVTLGEAPMRELQALMQNLQLNNAPNNDAVKTTLLNMVDKLIVQAHLDAMEWLRGKALSTGAIDWTFNKKRLQVDYGIPSANILSTRTGNDKWSGSSSKFWEDIRLLRAALKHNVLAFICHPSTIDAIRFNSANSAVVTEEGNGQVTIRKAIADGSRLTLDGSGADAVTLLSYGMEGEILDLANPGQTTIVPFMPLNKIIAVGKNTAPSFEIQAVGSGSTQPANKILGYTHIAPTVEGGGQPGRWADLYSPENQPWQVIARGVTNGLPIIEAPSKVAIASSDA